MMDAPGVVRSALCALDAPQAFAGLSFRGLSCSSTSRGHTLRRYWRVPSGDVSGQTLCGSIAGYAVGAALVWARRRHVSDDKSRPSTCSVVACEAASKGRGGGSGKGKGKGKGGSKGPSAAKTGGGAKQRRKEAAAKREEKQKQKEKGEDEEDFLLIPADGLVLSDLAEKVGQQPAAIITHFFKKGIPLNVNQLLERERCMEIAEMYDVDCLNAEDFDVGIAAQRGFLDEEYEEGDDVQARPPVVTVMGHVDHGKTTLLDTIRSRSVAASEAGGITQRIGAYSVAVGDKKVTFIDTPGHEAFTAMRARGAQVTDIAVLMCAADDGVMPQTQEAIAHALTAQVPIVVCINKIDVKNANVENARNQLMEQGLVPVEYGGDVPFMPCSAKNNKGIDELLEVISDTALERDLKAPYGGFAGGVVLESTCLPNIGVLSTLLVQKGTLKVGEWVVAGDKAGRIRSMANEAGREMKQATPSIAVQVQGFDGAPDAGAQFEVLPSAAKAKAKAAERQKEANKKSSAVGFLGTSSDALMLSLILKTSEQGAIDAVKQLFQDVRDSKWVNLRFLLAAPGSITESDVELASSCPPDQRVMIIGFGATVQPNAEKLANERGVDVRTFNVIYELRDAVVEALESSLGKEEELTEVGAAEILQVFQGRDGKVAGCAVLEGILLSGGRVKVTRDDKVVGEGNVTSLRQGKSEVQEVEEDNECGFFADGFDDWQEGDVVTCYRVELVGKKIGGDS